MTGTRDKIMLGGYELWLDKSYYSARSVIICDSETSKTRNGLIVDIMGSYPYIWVSGLGLTDTEKQELKEYLKKDEQLIKILQNEPK